MTAHGLRSVLELCRVSNLPTVWTNVLAGLVLAGAPWRPGAALAVVGAASCLYVGGMCLNDLMDVAEDRVHKPSRPLPSGRVSSGQAWILTLALFAAALGLLFAGAGWRAGAAGSLLLGAVVLYDTLHRRHPATVLLMAACRGLVFVVAALAVSEGVPGRVAIAALVQSGYVVVLTALARREKTAGWRVSVPALLAGISLVDGVLLAVLAHPAWLAAGIAGAGLTRLGQRFVPGD
jgi:4-hydroxybenzoate polyprenyltransferase